MAIDRQQFAWQNDFVRWLGIATGAIRHRFPAHDGRRFDGNMADDNLVYTAAEAFCRRYCPYRHQGLGAKPAPHPTRPVPDLSLTERACLLTWNRIHESALGRERGFHIIHHNVMITKLAGARFGF